jgi:hypothetical protein
VIAYYSTIILLRAGSQPTPALLASLGFGVINFVFALPAFWTIDTFGRRSLLLATFPFMAVCHALISIAFGVTDSNQTSNLRIGLTIASMYLFGIAYSPGEGPVPFVGLPTQFALRFSESASMDCRCTPPRACRCTTATSVRYVHSNKLIILYSKLTHHQEWAS